MSLYVIEGVQTRDMEFHEITLEDKAWMDERFREDDWNACEYTFANNFIWRKIYQVAVAEIYGCLVIRSVQGDRYCYSYPVGAGDKRAAVGELLAISRKDGQPLRMAPLSAESCRRLSEWFPGRFLMEADRDDFDYIYAKEKLADLKGKKLHGKRNHIARFKDGGAWSYEPVTDDNLEECRTMTYNWIKMRSDKWNEEMEQEVSVLHEAFDHRRELGLIGGVLRREDEIVAFSMGEPLNSDTFVVHFEKAFPDMQGAYPMINQQFVLHACGEYAYVNREEDTGDLGLRKAKLSYYPEILLEKYVAVESGIVYANRETEREQIVDIWQKCFGDEREYIDFYMQERMTDHNMLVVHEDGKIVSMASFLPVRYLCGAEYVDARYVYAVATLPEYRGRGLAARILKFAQEYYGQPLLLAPAEKTLTDYYEKLGFVTAFADTRAEQEVTLTALSAEEPYETKTLTASEYVKLRDEKLQRNGYVQWDEEAVGYAIRLCERADGGAVLLTATDGTQDLLLYEKDGDLLVIGETTLDPDKLGAVLPQLLAESGTCRVRRGQMGGMLWLPQGLSGAETATDGYLALTLG